MTKQEMDEIMRLAGQSDTSTWPVEDQLKILFAYMTLAKTIAPIVLKNTAKDKKATFLFKMEEED